MVRLYLLKKSEKGKKQYIDVGMWSLVKAYILSWLIIVGLVLGTVIIIGIIISILRVLIFGTA